MSVRDFDDGDSGDDFDTLDAPDTPDTPVDFGALVVPDALDESGALVGVDVPVKLDDVPVVLEEPDGFVTLEPESFDVIDEPDDGFDVIEEPEAVDPFEAPAVLSDACPLPKPVAAAAAATPSPPVAATIFPAAFFWPVWL